MGPSSASQADLQRLALRKLEAKLEERDLTSPSRARDHYASAIIPVHHWVNLPVSTSYLRTKASLPSSPIRNTDSPAGMMLTLPPSRTAIGARSSDHEHARARIDREGARVNAIVGAVDQSRFPVLLIDRETGDVAIGVVEHGPALRSLCIGRRTRPSHRGCRDRQSGRWVNVDRSRSRDTLVETGKVLLTNNGSRESPPSGD